MKFKKGINIGSWLCHREMTLMERKAWLTPTDVHRIRDYGFDHIRVAIKEIHFWDENDQPIEEAFDILLTGLQWMMDADLDIILNMHILRSHFFGDPNPPELFDNHLAQDRFVEIWLELSERLRQFPIDRFAYELLNEPVATHPESWNQMVARLHQALRQVEPHRTIVIGSNRQQSPHTFKDLEVPLNDPNLMLDFHFYEPNLVTHFRAPWLPNSKIPLKVKYPGRPLSIPPFLYAAIVKVIPGLSPAERLIALDENRYYDREEMVKVLGKPLELSKRHKILLRCGEFGVIEFLPEELGARWLEDSFSVFKEWNIGWSYWCYEKGTDVFGILDQDGIERPPMKVIKKYLQ
jgi:endoglucanase